MMLFKKYGMLALLGLLWISPACAQKRLIAITIDDLPFVGSSRNFHLNRILDTLKECDVPATGFIIANEVSHDNWPMLHKFREAGFGLGNHTFTHANAKRTGSDAYIREIATADKMLSSVLTEPKFFRFPYLEMGKGSKKEKIINYLTSQHYRIAPITIDSKDFTFNQLLLEVPQDERWNFLKVLKACYLDFLWQQTLKADERNRYAHKEDKAHILLIHANLLNTYVLADIIELYKKNGFTFVSLEEALKTFNGKSAVERKKTEAATDTAIESFKAWD